MNKKSVAAIILAAGQSSRMGDNKLLLPLGDQPILEHVLLSAMACDFAQITVVYTQPEVEALAQRYGADTVYNADSIRGQSTSIVLGTAHTAPVDGLIFISADQPFVSGSTIKQMRRLFDTHPDCFVAAAIGDKRSSPVIFPWQYRQDLLELTGDIGGRGILMAHKEKLLLCQCAHEMECFDVDTKEDYSKAQAYFTLICD